MDGATRKHRRFMKKRGYPVSPADERPDWMIALSDWMAARDLKRTARIAGVVILTTLVAAGIFACYDKIDRNQRRFQESDAYKKIELQKKYSDFERQ
jgi:hypothetical protein